MKKSLITTILSLFFLSSSLALAFQIPSRPAAFVNDYSSTLSKEEIKILEQKILDFEKKTTDEIAIVIIPSLDGDPIENVAQDIFTKWGIGKKDANNGVLLLVAINDRKMRIHTGYGVEGSLPDLATAYIQDEVMAPLFKAGDYYSGLNGAVDKIISSLGGENVVPQDYNQTKNKLNLDWWHLAVFIFIAFQWLVAILGRSKSWWGGGVLGAVVGGAIWFFASFSLIVSLVIFVFLIVFGLGLDFFVSRQYEKRKISGGHYPWWIGGGRGGGLGGGGFGGFGGGSSGGGGSSSSW